MKLSDLATKLGLELKDLRAKIKKSGFELSPKARVIDDETADLLLDEFKSKKAPKADAKKGKAEPRVEAKKEEEIVEVEKEADVAEIYDEIIAQEQEREIIKSQRKKTAGRDVKEVKKEFNPEDVVKKVDKIQIADHISVKEFAEKTGIKIAKIIGELMKNGILANINQIIDFETAQIIADDLGIKIERIRTAGAAADILSGDISNLIKEDDVSQLKIRPPVVCVMGHVDHGKTRLLDSIRNTHVIDSESGGITQHIGAYQVTKKNRLITFLDTPGHEAFTEMRARGAKVTDIAILVVAADEGVKPQTIEAINHAKEAKVSIIVALSKIDKPDANIERVKGQLAENGLTPEDWGGDTIFVPVSALSGQGIDDLLDMVLLTADMANLKANPNREAVCTVIEAHLDHSLGPIATVLVNTGTLKVGDNVVCGGSYGRVKIMKDYIGKNITEAPPSTPVLIAGIGRTPKSGDVLQVMKDEKTARIKAMEISNLTETSINTLGMSALNQLISNVKSDKVLKIVIKADTKGSVEAIKNSLEKIKDEEVALKIIHGTVGKITKSDIMMASASKGIVIGFHTDFDSPIVAKIAEQEHVEVKNYKIIYNIIEDIKKILSGLLQAEVREVLLGKATVQAIFFHKRNETIAGLKITDGKLQNKSKLKVVRGKDENGNDKIIGEGMIDSLKRVAEPVHEINAGNDCGIKFKGDVELKEGDVLEAYTKEETHRTIF
ncbi:MAG: translation initiation factor IF-2 [Candidatus Gracilibacteria bacterium]|jgi:translation initiation factor IF-2